MIIESGLWPGTLQVTLTDGDIRRVPAGDNRAELHDYAAAYLKENGLKCDLHLQVSEEFKKRGKFESLVLPANIILFGLLVFKSDFKAIIAQGLTINHSVVAPRVEIVEGNALTINRGGDLPSEIEELQGGKVVLHDGTVGGRYKRPLLRVPKGSVQSVEGQGNLEVGRDFEITQTKAPGIQITALPMVQKSIREAMAGNVLHLIQQATSKMTRRRGL